MKIHNGRGIFMKNVLIVITILLAIIVAFLCLIAGVYYFSDINDEANNESKIYCVDDGWAAIMYYESPEEKGTFDRIIDNISKTVQLIFSEIKNLFFEFLINIVTSISKDNVRTYMDYKDGSIIIGRDDHKVYVGKII